MPPDRAFAVPSFAEQTGQPCASCHVGAFGPRLKQTGRDFKLYGYVSTDMRDHFPPLAATAQLSLTHTETDQPGGAAPHFGANDNVSVDQLSLYYAGRILPELGMFAQFTYDGVGRVLSWDNLDLRHAQEGTLFDQDLVAGITLNNNPTVQDLWNSTPAWGFPFVSSSLAPTPANATLIDGALARGVIGAGIYAMWDDLVYLEADIYKGLGHDVRNALGVVPVSGSNSIAGIAPYWRAALEHEFDEGREYAELGTYGIAANSVPGANGTTALEDHTVDVAADATFQWVADPKRSVSDVVSAQATLIDEDEDLDASHALLGTRLHDRLRTWRADVSYAIDATYIPTVQFFHTEGSNDPARFATAEGSPNSSGWVAELGFVPWGKPDSPVSWANARVSLQYVAYTRFDGTTVGASRNNTIFLNLWLAMAFNR